MTERKIYATRCLAMFIVLAITAKLDAQIKIPAASSAQIVTQELGIGKIILTYARPNVKGRTIFGDLIPYGEIWRTGANNATTLGFSTEVLIAGQTIPAGTYGLFTIPGKDKWTIILNKNSKQWGSYTYDQSDDLIRFTVKPDLLPSEQETFTISFPEVTTTTAKLNISWERTSISFDILANQDAAIMASIDQAMGGNDANKPYLQAAQYYYSNGKDLGKALQWANEAEKKSPDAPHVKYWKALIQFKAGDKAGASATAQSGAKIAADQNNEEYIRLNKQVISLISKEE